MAVGVPPEGRDQVFPEGLARIGHRITIDDPGILQEHGGGAGLLPGSEVSQAKESIRSFLAADSGHFVIQ